MRYCTQCHKITIGKPRYCNFCGSSYDVKLCPARHPNPRTAEICSECGSRDLSAPAPKLAFWIRPVLYVVTLLPGVVLLIVSVQFFIGVVTLLLTNRPLRIEVLLLGLALGLVWYGYMLLPNEINGLFHTRWHESKRNQNRS